MPFIQVEMLRGRTLAQRRAFALAVTKAAVEHLGVSPGSVRIRFVELAPEDLARGGLLASDADPHRCD
ncbi:MAG: tautomerase family protein [Firmicutes bacterium]|nr:tautomerase family protein [Bacillota bacterium]